MTRSLESWLRDFTVHASRTEATDRLIELVVGGITDSVPMMSDDPVLREEVVSSIRGHWLYFVDTLDAVGNQQFTLPRQATTLPRTIAHRGMDVTVLLKLYRAAYKGVFSYLTEVSNSLGADDPDPHEVLTFLWPRGERWLDTSIDHLIEVFYSERAAITEGARRRQRLLIDTVLAGTAVDAASISNELRYPLTQCHTAGIAWMTDADADDTSALAATAADLAVHLGAPPPLVTSVGARDLWFWIATPAEPTDTGLAGVADSLQSNGIRAALGAPATGTAGFRTGHQQARAVQQLVLHAPLAPGLVKYSDVELLCVTVGNDDLMRAMVDRELGALTGDDKNLGPIRDTVLTFLANRNVEETAAALFVHKNTVRYRLGKAEELLGHPLALRATEVDLALRYVALFGADSVR